jgi:DNA polymerase V
MLKKKLHFFTPDFSQPKKIAFIDTGIKAGFPSPAADFEEEQISLDQFLIKNPEATFFAKASGNSMINAGISDGDLLVIDRSLEAKNNTIAVCYVDGEFTVKRIRLENEKVFLLPENDDYKPIEITKGNELMVWGVVIYVIKKMI